MKAGPNVMEQAQIKSMQAEGMTVEQVSKSLNIEPSAVENWFLHFNPILGTVLNPNAAPIPTPIGGADPGKPKKA